jgi:hypothetical protein
MKPKCLLLLLGMLITGLSSYAQLKESTNYNIWSLQNGDTTYVYGRMANVRTASGTEAAVQDSLPCGTQVTIMNQDTVLQQVKGIYAPWVKVRYNKNGNDHEDYLWLGMLTLGHFEQGETKFVYGLEKIIAAKNNTNEDFVPAVWFIRVKAVDNSGRVLDEQEIKMDGLETSVCSGKLLGDMGLENTTDIIRINFGGEACGIPTKYYYFGWTGAKFLPLPGKMEVGDAGVFYHTETFLFPKEQGGQPGKIIKLTEEGEADEEKVDKNGEPVFKIKKSRVMYNWNGKQAIKAK